MLWVALEMGLPLRLLEQLWLFGKSLPPGCDALRDGFLCPQSLLPLLQQQYVVKPGNEHGI